MPLVHFSDVHMVVRVENPIKGCDVAKRKPIRRFPLLPSGLDLDMREAMPILNDEFD